ncbi:dTDP-4-dehydrorhamnose 3,5-epimerase [Nonlabens xiamenensis]|uniref:dTDP-4-dehydrorhamnose 3,5-epimerase n=1 Tax=Nonlabens xiamenensis TaxID=2341043 RepID=UPI000F61197E|nr:dTDP-4-dehydrorhamnose 3,5-epimerase [Nonlabens xiamenensis]
MKIEATSIDECFILKPTIFRDDRGFFMESFNRQKFADATGLDVDFVQDNLSQSTYGVVRGLHAQKGVNAQAKLVSVLQGEVLDVAVDLRKGSATYGKVVSVLLNETNRHQLFVPKGCVHGFAVLSEQATFFYKCDNFYAPAEEYGIRHDEPSLGIDWRIPVDQRILSEKDQLLPSLADLKF